MKCDSKPIFMGSGGCFTVYLWFNFKLRNADFTGFSQFIS